MRRVYGYIYSRCAETMTEEAVPMVGADVMMRLGDCYYEGIGTEVDYKLARQYYQRAEVMFYERLEEGDFLIKGCYEKVVQRQNEIRNRLETKLPDFAWVN